MKDMKKDSVFYGLKGISILFMALCYFSTPLFGMSISAEDKQLFQEANQNYKDSEFKKAVEKYQQLANEYPKESAFQYNLGNALFRIKMRGQSILAYERAKVSDPRNKDIRENLRYVNEALEYRVEDKRNWYIQKGDELLMYLRIEEAYLLMSVMLCLLLLSWVYSSYFKGGQPWGWFRKSLLVLFCLCLIVVGLKQVDRNIIRDAIVIAKEADVRYGPSVEDQIAFQLGEGLKVYVIDLRENWSRVILTNKETGWMKNSQIEKV